MRDGEMRALFDSYYRAVVIADTLFQNGIFRERISLNFSNEDKKTTETYDAIGCLIAETDRSINLDSVDGGVRSVICDFYFNDLRRRGSEWAGAKFEQEFRAQRELAERELKAIREEDYWYLSSS